MAEEDLIKRIKSSLEREIYCLYTHKRVEGYNKYFVPILNHHPKFYSDTTP